MFSHFVRAELANEKHRRTTNTYTTNDFVHTLNFVRKERYRVVYTGVKINIRNVPLWISRAEKRKFVSCPENDSAWSTVPRKFR